MQQPATKQRSAFALSLASTFITVECCRLFTFAISCVVTFEREARNMNNEMAMSVQIHWTNDQVYKLIELFKEKQFLWDTTMEEHKDRNKKHEAWCEISRALNTDKQLVEKKMKTLIGQFQRELKKTNGEETSKWFAYPKLLFMKDRRVQRESYDAGYKTESNETENYADDYNDDSGSENDSQDPLVNPKILIRTSPTMSRKRNRSHLDNPRSILNTSIPTIPYMNAVPRPYLDTAPMPYQDTAHRSHMDTVTATPHSDTAIEEAFKIMKLMYESRQTRDEFDIFGEHIAMKLRSIKDAYARNTAQFHINNVLYKADIGEYDRKESSSTNLPSNETK